MKRIALLLLTGLSVAIAQDTKPEEKKESSPLKDLLKDNEGGLSDLAKRFLGDDGGNKLFYFPTKFSAIHPKKYGYKFEDVTFKTSDEVELHGWWLPAASVKTPKATIVFSHGNAGSLGDHLGFVTWFVRAGYNVFMYDYRGFGKSKGAVSRLGLIQDVKAAFSYVKTRKDVDATKLISYGHSLGGAKTITALAQEKVEGLRAVISFAGFASYQEMAQYMGGNVGASVVTDELSPIEQVDKLAPVPLLFLHGTKDRIVPLSQGEKLFEKAKNPKTLMKIEGGGHQEALAKNEGEYRKKVLSWLDGVLKK